MDTYFLSRKSRFVFTPSRVYCHPVDKALEDWFHREILPYEAVLMRYLAQKRVLGADIEDLRNEIYVRVWESAALARPAVPRAFLFGTARNFLIDLARHSRVVAIDLLEDLDAWNVLIDEVTPERQVYGRQQLQRLSAIFDRLPARCREVLWLRRIEGLPQQEVAARLGVTEAMVAKHVYRAMRYLGNALYGSSRGTEEKADDSKKEPERGI